MDGSAGTLNVNGPLPTACRLLQTKISLDMPPGAVNVVGGVAGGIGLLVQELDHERGTLHAVTVLLALFGAALIREVDLVDTAFLDKFHLGGGYLRRQGA